MAQELQVEATIQKVEQDGEWCRVTTDAGEFSTKFPDRASEALQYVGQRVLVAYEEANGGQPRQDRNGKWWPASRYIKGIASPGFAAPQLAPQQGYAQGQPMQSPMPMQPQAMQPQPMQPQPQPQQVQRPQGEDENTRNTRIMRQTAGKLAVWTLPLVPSEQRTFPNQIAIAEAWMRYFIGGAAGTGVPVNGAPAVPAQVADQMVAQVAGQMPGDDIPFGPAVH